jgi:hypothetical protein
MSQNVGSELPPLNMEKAETSPEFFSPETAAGAERTELQAAQAIETARSAPAPVPQAPPVDPGTQPMQQSVADPAVDDANMPVIADDADLIEKEWVLKAKEIVARTKHDPYQQNKEVERVKADYMKKRYNKEIKLTED